MTQNICLYLLNGLNDCEICFQNNKHEIKEHNNWMPISNIEVYLELKTKGDFFHLRILLNNSVILNGTRQKTERLQNLLIMCKEKKFV